MFPFSNCSLLEYYCQQHYDTLLYIKIIVKSIPLEKLLFV